jgi:DNA-binding transcriptional ArsR family regulator
MLAETQTDRSLPEAVQFELAAEVFRMLADATRVRLLWCLLDGERSVNELAELADKSAPAVSQHLGKLRLARLVTTRRQANHVFYRLENDHVSQLVADAIYHTEHTSGGMPPHHTSAGRLG